MNAKKQFSFSGIYAPVPIRWVNSLARIVRPAFDRPVSLQRDHLLEAAGRQTGLQDFGDPRFENALSALLESINQEGKLTFFGRLTVRLFLVENLCSRLRVVEVLKRFPEISRQNIQRPIFITGWYRTGTTYLHNLLASHPNVRVPLFWELRHPCSTLDPRSANPRRQIRRVHMESRIHRWLAPGFDAVHPMQTQKPEECLHLFDKACVGTTSFFISEAQSFAWWLLDHGIEHGYDFYKIQLQLLNWLRPGRQWVLKWPYHCWHLDTLLQTFPDAAVIHLHRDPREAIPSVCSLAAAARAPFCEGIDVKALGKFWLSYCEAALQRRSTALVKADNNRAIDIRYQDLKQNPLSVIHQIQKTINLDGSEAWIKSLQTYSKTLERKVPGRHHYSPAQFGLDADQIHERFSRYIEDYGIAAQ
jgi:Sulfotransferase family